MATLREALEKEKNFAEFSDVIVTVEDKEFPCHKFILAARSEFFEKALKTDMKEKKEGKIEVKGTSSEIFEELLQYLYVDKDVLNRETFFEILLAANQLQVESLMTKGEEFLSQNLTLDNCGHVYSLSQVRNWKDLEKRSWNLLERNFDKVDLTELDVLTHEDIKRLVASDQLRTRSEDVVVGKVLQWVSLGELAKPDNDSADDGGRAKYLIELLESCKYYLISYNFLWEVLNKNDNIKAEPRCRDLILEILRHKTQLDTHQHGCLTAEIHRDTDSLSDGILFIIGNCLYVQSLNGARGEPKFDFPHRPTSFSGGAFYNGMTYLEFPIEERSVVYEYDPRQQKVACCHESENIQGNVTVAFLPVGNSLIALRTSGSNSSNYFIESIALPCKPFYSWISMGYPTTRGMEVECVTSIGSKLLIFWKNANPGKLTIECYDLDNQNSQVLKCKLNPSTSVKTFKKGDQVFALQGDGMLWRLHTLEEPPYVKLVQEKQLWTSQEELKAVMLVWDKLIILRSQPEPVVEIQWCDQTSLEGVFANVEASHFKDKKLKIAMIHTVMDRQSLP